MIAVCLALAASLAARLSGCLKNYLPFVKGLPPAQVATGVAAYNALLIASSRGVAGQLDAFSIRNIRVADLRFGIGKTERSAGSGHSERTLTTKRQ
jgi:hypothetical protein